MSMIPVSIPGEFNIVTNERGEWVVRAEWYGQVQTIFTPGNNEPWMDLMDCLMFVKMDGKLPANMVPQLNIGLHVL